MANKQRPQISEIDPVPLYRSYGVTKKEGFFAKFNIVLARIIATVLLLFITAIDISIIAVMLYMLKQIGVVILVVIVFSIIYFGALKTVRKRKKFIRKLKRVCKKNNFRLEFHRSFSKGMKFNTQGLDFTVKTNAGIWCARFLTCKRKSNLVFEDKNTITVQTNIFTNKIKEVYGLSQKKHIRMDYSFNDALPTSSLPVVRALILNPAPFSIFKKDSDGVIGTTGNGEQMYGCYTVFTGSGFISTILR